MRSLKLRSVHPARISTKLVLFFTAILIIQSLISIGTLYFVVGRSNMASQMREMDDSLTATNQYAINMVVDMKIKADLFAAQQNVIDYTEFGLLNLLKRELEVLCQSLDIDTMGIYNPQSESMLMINADLNSFDGMRAFVSRSFYDDSQSTVVQNGHEIQLFVCAPIKRDDFLIGLLVMGKRLDSNFVSEMEQLTSTPTVYLFRNRLIHSNLVSEQLINDLIEPHMEELRNGKIIRQANYLIQGRLSTSGVDSPGVFINISDFSESLQLVQQYNTISLIITLGIFLIALIIAVRFYNVTILQPIQDVLRGINEISTGNFKPPFSNPGQDEFGKVSQAFNQMCLDLTRRDEELEKLSRFNSMILDNIPSGVLTIDRDFQVISANPAVHRLMGQSNNEALQKALLSNEPQSEWMEIREILQSGLLEEHYLYGKQVNLSGKENRTLSVTSAPLYSGVQEFMGVILILSDISELKRMQEKLNTSTRLAALGEMAAGVAHQVKNPLTVIKLSMEMLQDGLQKAGIHEHNDMIHFVLEEVTSLDHFVRTFLDFSHLPRRKQAFYPLQEMLEYSIAHLPIDQYPGVNIEKLQISEDLRVFGDKNLLIQAFSNLLINALQACGDQGSVRLEGKSTTLGLELSIEDDGMGMSKDTQEKIFNPFFTTKDNGTGLGLSIVHRIIEEHNGSIEVYSTAGEGTRFVILFGG